MTGLNVPVSGFGDFRDNKWGYENASEPAISLDTSDVKTWLEEQPETVIRSIYFFTRSLMEEKAINPSADVHDMSAFGRSDANRAALGVPISGFGDFRDTKWGYEKVLNPSTIKKWLEQEPVSVIRSMFYFIRSLMEEKGINTESNISSGPGFAAPAMRPLPVRDIIPPRSRTYPHADDDRLRLDAIRMNLKMVEAELVNVAQTLGVRNFDRNMMFQYTVRQREKLQPALVCVDNAAGTLRDFEKFLKFDKYRNWNQYQM